MQQEEMYEEKPTEQKANIYFELISGVAVPLAIAIASGVLAAFVVALVVNIASDFVTRLAGYNASIASIVGAIVTGLVWWGEIGQRRVNIKNSFIQLVEIATQHDIDGDGFKGEPPEISEGVIYIVSSNDGRTTNKYQIPHKKYHEEIARRTVNGVQFTQREYMRGKKKIMGLAELNDIKAALLKYELVSLDNPYNQNSSVTWTEKGIAFMGDVLEHIHPPTDVVEGVAVEL